MAKITSKLFILIISLLISINESQFLSRFHQTVDQFIKFDGMLFPKFVYSPDDAMQYLDHFGYMGKMGSKMNMSSPQMKTVLKDFQRFMGIEESGDLDTETMNMMNMPRCGVADNVRAHTTNHYHMNGGKRFRRYSLQGSMWETKNLTWRMTSYSSQDNLRGKERDIESLMEYALSEWAKNSGLTFTKDNSNKKANIEIGFKVSDHRDGNPFDGPGRTLAHAFFPQFGGATHFDDAEKWSIDGKQGVDLLSVAVHEFGHALGLGHSDNKDSLMYPTYAGKRTQLRKDDINGIEMLYGKSERRDTSYLDTNERKVPKVNSGVPDLCSDFRLDAADCNERDECFFFRDNYIWRINDDTSIYPGYPKLISQLFPGFVGKVDSVFTDENSGRTYITSKDRVWIYREPMTRAVRANDFIANIFRGLNTNYLDASTRWGSNGKTYLFKKNKYWKYEPEKVSRPISSKYPRSTKYWKGLPSKIDAAFFWPKTGKTYFFSGSQYYRYNDISDSIDSGNPPFPREASRFWLKCERGRSYRSDVNEISEELNESTDKSGQGFFKTVSSGLSRFVSTLNPFNYFKN